MRALTRTLLQSKWCTPASHSGPPLPRIVRCAAANLISISKGGSNLSFTILRCVARTGALVSAVTLAAWLGASDTAVTDSPPVQTPRNGPGEVQPGLRAGPGG